MNKQHEPNLANALTPRQLEVLALMAEGFNNAAIAEKMVLGVKSVENYINMVYQELNLSHTGPEHPRVHAVLMYRNQYHIPSPGSTPMAEIHSIVERALRTPDVTIIIDSETEELAPEPEDLAAKYRLTGRKMLTLMWSDHTDKQDEQGGS